MRPSLLILLALIGITACASRSPYGCPLDSSQKHCRSLEEVYSEARTAPRKPVKARSGASANNGATAQSNLTYQARTNPDAATQGQPVFQQPRVFRPWLAPYVDADGNLRSGEYVYFATPGEWNYGTTREPGAASSATLFAPQRPGGDLGFVPVESNPQRRPPSPASPSAPPAPASVTTREGITQPTGTLITR